MKNLLVLTADYFPYPASTTNCLEPLLAAWQAAGGRADIVTRRMRADSPAEEVVSDTKTVYRIDDVRTMHTIAVNEKAKDTVGKLTAAASKAAYYTRYCLRSRDPQFAGWDRNAVRQKCGELLRKNRYDAVLTVSHPPIPHEIVLDLKKAGECAVPWIVLEFDPFAYNESVYGRDCLRKYGQLEAEIFRTADRLLLTPELFRFYADTPFSAYRDKMTAMPFANLNPIRLPPGTRCRSVSYDSSHVECIFGGALSEDIRNPNYAISVFARTERTRLHILTGSRTQFMQSALEKAGGRVRLYPAQPREEAYEAMLRADILVNIGNTVPFQAPGKLFEYMAVGKPILHFSKFPDDPCPVYLRDYPYHCVIREWENDPAAHAAQVERFCLANQGKCLSFPEVEQAVPDYIGSHVVGLFTDTLLRVIAENQP